MSSREAAAANIRRYRKAARLTQEQLGRLVGWTFRAVSAAERGRRHFTLDDLDKMAGALGVTAASLIGPTSCETCSNAPPAGFTCDTCGKSGTKAAS